MTQTSPINPDLPRAFRETTLGLIGVFQVYEVAPDLTEATAQVLGSLFRRHLGGLKLSDQTRTANPMHALADELENLAKRAPVAGCPMNGG